MNKRFEKLFDYAAKLPIIDELMQAEIMKYGDLGDLVFCVSYFPDQPGCGKISAYRRSAHMGAESLRVGNELIQNRIWFIENVPREPKDSRFYALIAILQSYRPRVNVDMRRPLLSIQVSDLPATAGFVQQHPRQSALFA